MGHGKVMKTPRIVPSISRGNFVSILCCDGGSPSQALISEETYRELRRVVAVHFPHWDEPVPLNRALWLKFMDRPWCGGFLLLEGERRLVVTVKDKVPAADFALIQDEVPEGYSLLLEKYTEPSPAPDHVKQKDWTLEMASDAIVGNALIDGERKITVTGEVVAVVIGRKTYEKILLEGAHLWPDLNQTPDPLPELLKVISGYDWYYSHNVSGNEITITTKGPVVMSCCREVSEACSAVGYTARWRANSGW